MGNVKIMSKLEERIEETRTRMRPSALGTCYGLQLQEWEGKLKKGGPRTEEEVHQETSIYLKMLP